MSSGTLTPPPDGDAHRVLLLTNSGEWAPLALVCIPGDEPLIRFQNRADHLTSLPTDWQRPAAAARRYGGGNAHAKRIAHGLLGGPWRVDVCPALATLATGSFDATALLRSEGLHDVQLPSASDPHWNSMIVLRIPAAAQRHALPNAAGASLLPPWLFSRGLDALERRGGRGVSVFVFATQVVESAAPMRALLQAVMEHAVESRVRPTEEEG